MSAERAPVASPPTGARPLTDEALAMWETVARVTEERRDTLADSHVIDARRIIRLVAEVRRSRDEVAALVYAGSRVLLACEGWPDGPVVRGECELALSELVDAIGEAGREAPGAIDGGAA